MHQNSFGGQTRVQLDLLQRGRKERERGRERLEKRVTEKGARDG